MIVGIVGSVELCRSDSVQQRGGVFGKFWRFEGSSPGCKAAQYLEAISIEKNQRRRGEEFASQRRNYRRGKRGQDNFPAVS